MHIVNQYLRGMIGGAPFENISKTTVINETIDVKSGLKLTQPTKNIKADPFKNQNNLDEEDDDIKPTIVYFNYFIFYFIIFIIDQKN